MRFLYFRERIMAKGSKGAKRFDEAAKERYLRVFADTGRRYQAAAAAGISGETARLHRKTDKAFDEACKEAFGAFQDKLEQEIYRRAVDGVDEPVFQKGQLVGKKRVYSDGLMQMLVKRFIPEYRDKQQVDMNVKGGVLVVGKQDQTEAEWLAKYGGDECSTDQ
jgi:hypothetical protein